VKFCPADGAVVTPADPFLGRVLMGQFELTAVAGRGAMGTVYRATQTTMGRTVAVKVLRADLLKDPSVVKRFLREARAAAPLNHPNIVTVHLVGEEEGIPYIVMEYVDGETLGALIEREAILPPRRALGIARQILSALSDAHGHGIVHRDLKPENILLVGKKKQDVVKVLDFGIAKIMQRPEMGDVSALTRDGTIFGTPHYISPEQAGGQEVDVRADLYSLGVILFRMATGRLPFEGTSGMQVLLRHMREAPPRPRAIRKELPDALDGVILKSLEKQPSDRYQDAERFIEAIDEVEALIDDPAQTIHGVPPAKAERRAARPLPQMVRAPAPDLPSSNSGDPALDAWAASAPADDGGDGDDGGDAIEEAAPRRVRDDPTERVGADDFAPVGRRSRLWLVPVAAVVIGGGLGLLYAMQGGGGTPTPAAVDGGARAATPGDAGTARPAPVAEGPLYEERVVSDGPFAMRLGFEGAPTEGQPALLRMSIADARGQSADAKVEVGVKSSSGKEDLVPVRFEGGAYRAEVAWKGSGRHRVRVAAEPRGGKALRSSFEVEVASSGAPPSPKVRHASPGGDDDKPLPTTVIGPPPQAPITPHAIGPAPPSAGPNPVPAPPAPAPPAPAPTEEASEDPYKILDRK
jgi:serine/threonine protein kinase